MSKEKALDIVLDEFMKIAEIPRPSHHEEKISEYLYQWAVQHGLTVEKDGMGEIIIDRPASAGCENVPRTIFQAHMDMVCVAEEGVVYNPETDPITVINDGVNLTAAGTSLGADDGIGIALVLYLLQDDSLKHGPIRAIFTVNEEDGMDSINIDAKYLEGSYLINLDWETIGSLCNSCAGGDFYIFNRKADWVDAPEDHKTMKIGFSNLLGGHSGVGINKGHANAIVSAATALSMLKQGGVTFQIAAFSGGQVPNAIPQFATVKLAVAKDDVDKALEIMESFRVEFAEAYANIEQDDTLTVEILDETVGKVLGKETGDGLIGLMTTVPNNVHTMSPFIDGLVESSSNLGVVDITDETVSFMVFARSSVTYPGTQLGVICKALADAFGYAFESDGHVPGWAVNPNSKLVKIACEQYEKLTGVPMIVEPVHAGVECGAFAIKNPELDMIAMGPTLIDVHTPAETCCIADVKTMADLLIAILEDISK